MPDNQLLTTDELLGYLKLNLKTVYRLIRSGSIPAVRVGHQWRFRREDIDAWLASRQGPAPAFNLSPATATASALIVDDEGEVRVLIKSILEDPSCGCESVLASNGQEALAILRARHVDVLIADLKMPHLDGLGLVREIRRELPRLPVIIVTGASTENAAVEALNLGVSGYLLKPFRREDVIAVVKKALADRVPKR